MKQESFKISELKFMKPSHKSNYGEVSSDVTITITKAFSKEKDKKIPAAITFTFRNKCFEYLAPSERLEILFIGSRIYFRDSEDGYKISKKENQNNRYMKVDFRQHGYEVSDVISYVGNWKLQYDQREKLYFIETNIGG